MKRYSAGLLSALLMAGLLLSGCAAPAAVPEAAPVAPASAPAPAAEPTPEPAPEPTPEPAGESLFAEYERMLSAQLGTLLSTGEGYPALSQRFTENVLYNYANCYLYDQAVPVEALGDDPYARYAAWDMAELEWALQKGGITTPIDLFAEDLTGSPGVRFLDGTFYFGMGDVGFSSEVRYAGEPIERIEPGVEYPFVLEYSAPGEEPFTTEVYLAFAPDEERGELCVASVAFGDALNALLTSSPFMAYSQAVDPLLCTYIETGEEFPAEGPVSPEYAASYLFQYVNRNYSYLAEPAEGLDDGAFDLFTRMTREEVDAMLANAFGNRIAPEELPESPALQRLDGDYYFGVGGDDGYVLFSGLDGSIFQEPEMGKEYPIIYELSFIGPEEERIAGQVRFTVREEDGRRPIATLELDEVLKSIRG